MEYNKGEYYLLSRNMYFAIFTVCTAPMFLTSLSLLKYGLWFVTILLLVIGNRIRMKLETVMVLYLVFFCWLALTMTWTTAPRDGYMMLIKYFIPILFLWLGYSSLRNEKDLVAFLKAVNNAACVYCFLIGGFANIFIPPLYVLLMDVFTTYAGFSCFLISVFIVPILLYWLTKDKKYIYCALWMLLSPVLQSVRTGIGGMMLVFCMAVYLRYKQRSIPALLFAGTMFLSVVLFVPSVNQKFFGENAGTVTGGDIVQGNALSLDNIEMSGRDFLWENVKNNCFYGNETFGGGLGTSGRFMKDYGKATQGLTMMHNDYLQIICDTGLVGISLLTIFYIAFIIKVIAHVVMRKSSVLVKLTGIMALSSMVGVGFAMYFDNVVSNSMQSLVMPFIYWGFFFKALDIEGKEKRTLDILRFRKERI
ncbi:MAG: O-antigen ligase family protein [Bacteroidaceae bacterium]|nr:O-antigen ligase family protein [Bacteroidaceae bacterium]